MVMLGAVVAAFVQGLSGFAFGIVATSIWVWWLPPQVVAPLSVFGALVGQLVAAITVRRGLQAPLLLPMLAGAALGIPLGLVLLPRLDAAGFQLGLGLMLALWCPVMLMSHRLPRLRWGGRWADTLAGLLGGVTGALAGFSGPLPTLWATLRGWERDTLRAVIQNFNLAVLAVTFVAYGLHGLYGDSVWHYLPGVAVSVLVPVLLGARVYAGLSTESFRRLVLGLLTATGAALLLRALPTVLARAA